MGHAEPPVAVRELAPLVRVVPEVVRVVLPVDPLEVPPAFLEAQVREAPFPPA